MSKLNEQTILNKEFNVEFKGYSMLEVDSFLDQIILDYQYFSFELQKSKEIILNTSATKCTVTI
jgi:DivIVA domain-containing protein